MTNLDNNWIMLWSWTLTAVIGLIGFVVAVTYETGPWPIFLLLLGPPLTWVWYHFKRKLR